MSTAEGIAARNVLMSGYTGYKRKLQHVAKISCNCCKKRNSSKPFEKVKEMKGGRRIVKTVKIVNKD